jgi:hypothetical protein
VPFIVDCSAPLSTMSDKPKASSSSAKKAKGKKKASQATDAAKANGVQKLMASASRLKSKESPAALLKRCWSWEHWRPFDAEQ